MSNPKETPDEITPEGTTNKKQTNGILFTCVYIYIYIYVKYSKTL